jgi:ubiquinone/menaquinone biosynthesis C-methylase UbiE|tara:strand:+ start:576 stop:1127 length:552 start_codon:yes stop_codon:yes gene_type:complete
LNTRDQVYESIGVGYSSARRPDTRIHQLIVDALGNARSVLNAGAGAGNYEPSERSLVAVEPSLKMITQRKTKSGLAVRGVAEALPFGDQCFDAALATFTLHHWTNVSVGLLELKRVSKRQVILLFEPAESLKFWLVEYFPECLALPSETGAPGVDDVRSVLDVQAVSPVPVPADCTDGFAGAY